MTAYVVSCAILVSLLLLVGLSLVMTMGKLARTTQSLSKIAWGCVLPSSEARAALADIGEELGVAPPDTCSLTRGSHADLRRHIEQALPLGARLEYSAGRDPGVPPGVLVVRVTEGEAN